VSAGAFCTREVDLAEADEPVHRVAERMRQRSVGTLVVLDAARTPIGILTDRDLVTRVLAERRDPLETRVRDVMTRRPRTISEGASIGTALATMRSGAFRRLPVVDAQKRLVGLLALDDVLRLLAEEMQDVGTLLERETPTASLG